MPDGGHYELIDGELKERRVSFLSNLVAAEVTGILRDHCRFAKSRMDSGGRTRLPLLSLESCATFGGLMSRSSGLIA